MGGDADTAYQFTSGQLMATVPENTGIMGQYVLSVNVANTTPPQITGTSLPIAGTSTPIILSTGLNSTGSLIATNGNADSNWTVDQPGGGTAAAQIVTPSGADWYSGWPADGPNSDWIAVNANSSSQPAAPYTFYRTFDLTGYNLYTIVMSVKWASTMAAVFTSTATSSTAETNNYNTSTWGATITVAGTSGDFNPGLNTLTIKMTNVDKSLDAVRLEGSVTVRAGAGNQHRQHFTQFFSEDMNPATVNNTANYVLQDSNHNIYHLGSPSYTGGVSATYPITDGPLQPGNYTLTISGLADRLNNPLAQVVENFTVQGVPPFMQEGRNHGSLATPTSLSTNPARRSPATSPMPRASAANDRQRLVGGFRSIHEQRPHRPGGNRLLQQDRHRLPRQRRRHLPTGRHVSRRQQSNRRRRRQLRQRPRRPGVTNSSDNTVSVLLGNGDGTFQAQKTYAVGTVPYYMAVADLTGSGKFDLVVANYNNGNTGSVSILMGNGDGTFQNAVSLADPSNGPVAVKAGNITGGPNPDLVVANYASSTVTVFPSTGTNSSGVPTYGTPATYAVGTNPYDVVLGKFRTSSSSPLLDIAVANYSSSTVSILLNNGSGTFPAQPSQTYPVGSGPFRMVSLTVGGNVGLAVADYNGNNVGVLLGNGDGTFQPVATYSANSNPRGLTVGDVTGDGLPDLVTADWNGNRLTLLPGQRPQPLAADPAASGVYSGYGRGATSSNSDSNYWSFTGQAGQTVMIAVDAPGHPNAAYWSVILYDANGTQLTSFTTNYTGGAGGSAPLVLPHTGTYFVRVFNGYSGYPTTGLEYNLRVSLADPTVQVGAQANNSFTTANPVTFAPAPRSTSTPPSPVPSRPATMATFTNWEVSAPVPWSPCICRRRFPPRRWRPSWQSSTPAATNSPSVARAPQR